METFTYNLLKGGGEWVGGMAEREGLWMSLLLRTRSRSSWMIGSGMWVHGDGLGATDVAFVLDGTRPVGLIVLDCWEP